MIEFISIKGTDGRTSSLVVREECLEVSGDLPHSYEFRPKTAKDRDRLVEVLQEYKYKE